MKSVRHCCLLAAAVLLTVAGRGAYFEPPIFWFVDTVVAIGCAVLAIWCINRYVPHAHEALQAVPAVLHNMVDTLKQWWAGH